MSSPREVPFETVMAGVLVRWESLLLELDGCVSHLDVRTVVTPQLARAQRAQVLVDTLRREVKQTSDRLDKEDRQ